MSYNRRKPATVRCYDCQAQVADLKSHRQACPNSKYAHSALSVNASTSTSSTPSSTPTTTTPSSNSTSYGGRPSTVKCYDCGEMVAVLKTHRQACSRSQKGGRGRGRGPAARGDKGDDQARKEKVDNRQRAPVTTDNRIVRHEKEKKKEIESFEDTKDVYFLLDVSSSMSGARLQEAKDTLTTLVSQMDSRDRLSIISFDTNAYFKLKPRPVEQITRQDELPGILGRIFARGGTALYDAVWMAVNQIRDKKKRVVVVALTDGEDNSSSHSLEQTLAFVAQFPNVTLDIIHIDGSGVRNPAYHCLCEGRGEYVVVEEVVVVRERILTLLRGHGVVFSSTERQTLSTIATSSY